MRQKAGSAAMGANKNGQRIMCSVICTPNTGHPVLGVHINCDHSFYIRVVWYTHKNGTASNWCSNWCRRSGLRSAASYCRPHNAAHLRPQVVFIHKAPPLSGGGEGLAGKAAGNDGDCFKSCFLKKRLLRKSVWNKCAACIGTMQNKWGLGTAQQAFCKAK